MQALKCFSVITYENTHVSMSLINGKSSSPHWVEEDLFDEFIVVFIQTSFFYDGPADLEERQCDIIDKADTTVSI